jgi:hypothetical protein
MRAPWVVAGQGPSAQIRSFCARSGTMTDSRLAAQNGLGYSRLASARADHGTRRAGARALTLDANLGQEIVGRGALAGRIRPLEPWRLLAVTPEAQWV